MCRPSDYPPYLTKACAHLRTTFIGDVNSERAVREAREGRLLYRCCDCREIVARGRGHLYVVSYWRTNGTGPYRVKVVAGDADAARREAARLDPEYSHTDRSPRR